MPGYSATWREVHVTGPPEKVASAESKIRDALGKVADDLRKCAAAAPPGAVDRIT